MRIARIGLSVCYAYYSLVLFYAVTGVLEIAHDQLDGKPLPKITVIAHFFDPIGLLLLIYPLMIGFACWRRFDIVGPSFQLLVTHFLLVGFATVVFISVSLATSFFTYMNGVHPISIPRIIGNIAIGMGILFTIVRTFRKSSRTEQDEALNP